MQRYLTPMYGCIPVSAVCEKSFNRDPKGSASSEGDRIPSVHALAAGSRLNEKRTYRTGGWRKGRIIRICLHHSFWVKWSLLRMPDDGAWTPEIVRRDGRKTASDSDQAFCK